MKNIGVLTILFALFLAFAACKDSEAERRKKSIEMMTAQTLGLAYLEEFKLEEAEGEFLRMIELAPDDKLGYANLGLVYLRMGTYRKAEEQLLQAIKIDPEDADVKLLLATVYRMDGKSEKAVTVLQDALIKEPGHLKILYELSELYSAVKGDEAIELRQEYLTRMTNEAPSNIVPQLQLTEIFIKAEESDKAIERLEIIQKQSPEFPKESLKYFDQTMDLLRLPDSEKALISFTIFHNYLKVSFPYQQGINELKGPGGSLIGFPLINYNRQVNNESLGDQSVLEVISFKDVTENSGLHYENSVVKEDSDFHHEIAVKTGDYNGDGTKDIYFSSYVASENKHIPFLYTNVNGRFENNATEVGVRHSGSESEAEFADFDNDGFLDLFITNHEAALLYRNEDKGILTNVTEETGLTGAEINKALFFDMDQDGDLDLFQAGNNGIAVFGNNGDGTFTENSEAMGFASYKLAGIEDAAFGDFDDDGDVDLITVGKTGSTLLFDNLRQGRFEKISVPSIDGFSGNSVEVGDVNNDGFLDLFLGAEKKGKSLLLYNDGKGKFDPVTNMNLTFEGIENLHLHDALFFDFDNDGFQDILATGEMDDPQKSGLMLFHSDGSGGFENISQLFPENKFNGRDLEALDYDGDGDRDVIVALTNGQVKLFRNDGGNLNHFVNMKLVGLRTGSAKNNYFGIGAKVEMRAGDLYQSMVVTDPNIYFGLGDRARADIIRITWTNGVPQNILLPDADQALIEAQTLKGSCPFLYTWNGKEYEFVKDITWRSALGMPLGIMGGTTQYAFADASDDYIKIESDQLVARDGVFEIKVTSELWETIYMDQIELVVVDHPEDIEIYVPEQFTPPPFPGMKILQIKEKILPVSAIDNHNRNVLKKIAKRDDRYIDNLNAGKFQGITERHDLILDPGNTDEFENLHLFLRGWIFPTDASINVALSQSDEIKVEFPVIQMINKEGKWENVNSEMSFPMGKDKHVIVELQSKFLSKDHRIRIRTNMEIYWDEVFFGDVIDSDNLNTYQLSAKSADLNYRGFSESYRKGGRYGPHWFDYNKVDTNRKWRDLTGSYTRYGDVLPLLNTADNMYIISNAGDEISIRFDAATLPELKKGWKRDFLIHSVGWVKDGDMNTAAGNTVDPLPYHNMQEYPLREGDFPLDKELIDYQNEYNTRIVDQRTFQNAIKPNISEE
ncbi:FG-GAP-like repeat-containing protein [Lutimonas zeaxanthinifaciens]|uniref:FG-GAP-like repeat-containing protein n=1 Tax=Lutimonas zeaxanthinifaciens TaxID=3060215 RepID=UPI00265CAE4A|nr:FG-GAP-like repeat-containing protein [Lutimonas sp. YSD2104]WKK66675.1 FG-GAP-like repeat-containing protein [Lutimonas sp. YSD2104]